MDGKKYVKIGKAAEMIGCSPQTLRNYERKGIFVPEAVLETAIAADSSDVIPWSILSR